MQNGRTMGHTSVAVLNASDYWPMCLVGLRIFFNVSLKWLYQPIMVVSVSRSCSLVRRKWCCTVTTDLPAEMHTKYWALCCTVVITKETTVGLRVTFNVHLRNRTANHNHEWLPMYIQSLPLKSGRLAMIADAICNCNHIHFCQWFCMAIVLII